VDAKGHYHCGLTKGRALLAYGGRLASRLWGNKRYIFAYEGSGHVRHARQDAAATFRRIGFCAQRRGGILAHTAAGGIRKSRRNVYIHVAYWKPMCLLHPEVIRRFGVTHLSDRAKPKPIPLLWPSPCHPSSVSSVKSVVKKFGT